MSFGLLAFMPSVMRRVQSDACKDKSERSAAVPAGHPARRPVSAPDRGRGRPTRLPARCRRYIAAPPPQPSCSDLIADSVVYLVTALTISRPQTLRLHLVCLNLHSCDPDIFNSLDGDSRLRSR